MLSIVIPVLNEADSLEALYQEICETGSANHYELDIVFIDDGSRDRSWEIIAGLARRDPRVRGIRFRRNFGKAAALDAGFAVVRGQYVMTLDADLQDDPHEIPNFLAEMNKGFDVVSGWKKLRHDPIDKVWPSRVFNAMVSGLTGVALHDHNCGMKCYRREVVQEVELYGELHRFVPVLAAARGFRVSEVVVQHRARKFGKSKYGFTRFVKGFLDLLTVKFLTGFGSRPAHLLGTIGLGSFGLGLLGLVYLGAYWLLAQLFPGWHLLPLHQRPAVIYSMGLLLFGGQLLSVGFLAELFIAYHRPASRAYSISERIDGDVPASASPSTDERNS